MKSKIVLLLVAAAVLVASIGTSDALSRGKGGSSGSKSSRYQSYKGAKAIDGDTFRYGGKRYRVQQYNAPEIGQAGSKAATRSLQNKIDSGSHEWKPVAKDAYGRTIVRERPKD
jgi:endonuclease YncB( thermonuclease family)